MAERGGAREKVLRVVVVGGSLVGMLGGGATGAAAFAQRDEQSKQHEALMQRLDKAAELERQNGERLAHMEADISWLVRIVGAPSTDETTRPPRLGKR